MRINARLSCLVTVILTQQLWRLRDAPWLNFIIFKLNVETGQIEGKSTYKACQFFQKLHESWFSWILFLSERLGRQNPLAFTKKTGLEKVIKVCHLTSKCWRYTVHGCYVLGHSFSQHSLVVEMGQHHGIHSASGPTSLCRWLGAKLKCRDSLFTQLCGATAEQAQTMGPCSPLSGRGEEWRPLDMAT